MVKFSKEIWKTNKLKFTSMILGYALKAITPICQMFPISPKNYVLLDCRVRFSKEIWNYNIYHPVYVAEWGLKTSQAPNG
jgi:hypothetical protein